MQAHLPNELPKCYLTLPITYNAAIEARERAEKTTRYLQEANNIVEQLFEQLRDATVKAKPPAPLHTDQIATTDNLPRRQPVM